MGSDGYVTSHQTKFAMKIYLVPETEIIDALMDVQILAGSDWGVENEDPNNPGPGTGGDIGDNPPPPSANINSLWDEE